MQTKFGDIPVKILNAANEAERFFIYGQSYGKVNPLVPGVH